MPTCMATGLGTSPLTPFFRVPTVTLELLDKGCGSGRSSFNAGHHLPANSYQFNGGRSVSFPVPHVRRNGVVRAEGKGSDGSGTTITTTTTRVAEKSEADAIVDGMSFGELCDEFECISSPAVEATARQLARDILELREGNRKLTTYAVFVQYKDPVRSFKGREKFTRPSWIKTTLDNPTVAVREMAMLSSSTLNIKWTVRGKPRLPPASFIGGEVVLSINSTFILNQISGQVTEQIDDWDLSMCSPIAAAYFWATRLSYTAVEGGKDAAEAVAGINKLVDKGKDDGSNYYPDPSGDPRKFFQVDDNPQKDFYQVGLVIALIYLLVQFLKLTL